MDNWRVISQIAALFGIVFIIFAALAAFISYQQVLLEYSPFIPGENIIQVNILSAMLPFILLAILSFVVAAISSRAARGTIEKQTQTPMHSVTAEATG